jgi:hypothetical protein
MVRVAKRVMAMVMRVAGKEGGNGTMGMKVMGDEEGKGGKAMAMGTRMAGKQQWQEGQ